MKSWTVSYAAALGVLCCCDGLWLGLIARNFYKARIGQLLLAEPRWAIAVIFYLVHALGITVFAVRPALASGSWTTGLLLGAFFGFCAYATYDITNLATLRGWSMSLTLADLAWGTLATAIAALASIWLTRIFA